MNSEEPENRKELFDFESAFNAISDFVTVHDHSFRIIRANQSLCAFLGVRRDQIIGQHCFALFHKEDHPWPECPHVKAMDRKAPVTEWIENNALGVPLLVTCSPLFDQEGSVIGTVHVANDISLQKPEARDKEDLIRELNHALLEVRTLGGIIPICTSCKKLRDDKGCWRQLEQFFKEHAQLDFSHGICPDCAKKLYPDLDLKSNK